MRALHQKNAGMNLFLIGVIVLSSGTIWGSDSLFLSAPSYDVEWVQKENSATVPAQAPPRVGDTLEFKVKGLSMEGLQVAPVDLQEAGWVLSDSKFHITPLKPGKLTLESLPLQDSSGKVVARTNPATLDVASAIQGNDPRPQEPEGLHPPVGLEFPTWVVGVAGLLGLIALGLLILGLYVGMKRWKKRLPSEVKKETRSEDVIALEALTLLEGKDFLNQTRYKNHYFGTSEILKSYLGARFGFDAPESTTLELIQELQKRSALSAVHLDQLKELFDQLDRVKFTDQTPEVLEASQLIPTVKEFIQTNGAQYRAVQ